MNKAFEQLAISILCPNNTIKQIIEMELQKNEYSFIGVIGLIFVTYETLLFKRKEESSELTLSNLIENEKARLLEQKELSQMDELAMLEKQVGASVTISQLSSVLSEMNECEYLSGNFAERTRQMYELVEEFTK